MERTKEERRDDPIVVEMEPPWRGLTESSVILPSLWCVYAHGMGGGCVGKKERREGKERRRGTSIPYIMIDGSQKILIANKKDELTKIGTSLHAPDQ